MEFFTRVELAPVLSSQQIDYQSDVLCLGSCFANHLAEKLAYYKFSVTLNPFGVLFQPLAMQNLVQRAVRNAIFSDEDLFFHNDLWGTFQAHSSCSFAGKHQAISYLNERLQVLRQALETATHVVITLGTAWAYRLVETGEFVANCHKFPQKNFQKELLSIDAILLSLRELEADVRRLNKNAILIYTLSPIRHLRDGFVENQQSKALLITALHTFLKEQNSGNQHYFPAYEILLDELRDYRFFAEDMVHPSAVAVDYIWEKFKNVFVKKNVYPIMAEVQGIVKDLAHKPFNPESKAHSIFLENLQKKIEKLQKQNKNIQF